MTEIAVVVIGDSAAEGALDITTGAGMGSMNGFFQRGFYNVNGRSIPSLWMSRFSSSAATLITNFQKRAPYLKYCTHGVNELSAKDILDGQTPAQTLVSSQWIWGKLRAGGIRHVEQTATYPRTTSTDNWLTVANQTPFAGFEVGGVRDQFNALVVAEIGVTVDGVIDVDGAVRDATATDKFKANGVTPKLYVDDGAHLSPTGCAAAAVPVATRAAGWV